MNMNVAADASPIPPIATAAIFILIPSPYSLPSESKRPGVSFNISTGAGSGFDRFLLAAK